jgi:hypothetical protein
MFDLVLSHISEIASFITGLIGGSFITIRIVNRRNLINSGAIVDQSGVKAGGDVVGGNKTSIKN